MSGPAPEVAYSLTQVQQMLGLSRTVVAGLIAAGFVTPERGARNALRFSFRDLMLLRTAHGLQRARIPPRRILSALARLRAQLPASMPLTGLRIAAVGSEVVVQERGGARAADSGQWLMDFEAEPAGRGEVAFIAPEAAPPLVPEPAEPTSPDHWFARGEAAEAHDRAAAEQAYREALQQSPGHVRATVNLGALLCEAGRCEEAAALYQSAVARGVADALLHFNHAIALEDLGQDDAALVSYARALALQPDLADAHYNTGCLLEKRGDERGALRHFSAYRRLQQAEAP